MSSETHSSFQSLGLSAELLTVIQELGYEKMTPIQEQSIPLLLDGKDVIGQSQTGSGKTAAFSIPFLEKMTIDQSRWNRNVQAMVICPTRELCAQVTREIRKLGRRKIGLQVLELAGGSPVGPQARLLEQGVHVVVGTAGRILDHLERGNLDLSFVKTVVLDEADRMLDMGFQDEMERILEALPENRQTVLFSATFPRGILQISDRFQKDAVMVKIEASQNRTFVDPSQDQELPQNQGIEQKFYVINAPEKDLDAQFQERMAALYLVLGEERPQSAIVFCNTKATTFEVVRGLAQMGVSCSVLNGDLEQRERDLVMTKFRNQSIRVLVATDVAARGIDVAELDLVVNFELPQKPDVYTHRIGRTGRAGKTGKTVGFILEREKNKLAVVEALARGAVCIPFDSITKQSEENDSLDLEAKMSTLLIFEGRKNKMRPGDILGALTGEAGGLSGSDIGKIEIHDFFSYVAISKSVAKVALERLQQGKIKGRRVRVEWPR